MLSFFFLWKLQRNIYDKASLVSVRSRSHLWTCKSGQRNKIISLVMSDHMSTTRVNVLKWPPSHSTYWMCVRSYLTKKCRRLLPCRGCRKVYWCWKDLKNGVYQIVMIFCHNSKVNCKMRRPQTISFCPASLPTELKLLEFFSSRSSSLQQW